LVGWRRRVCGLVVIILATGLPLPAGAASLTGSFASIARGADVNLTVAGPLDWVHWGLYTENSVNRKVGVTPLISDFTLLQGTNGYTYVYEFADNYNGYSWSDGTPSSTVTNTPTGVWAYGIPDIGSGFQITAPADTALKTLKVYVGAFSARGKFEAFLSDNSAPVYTNTALVNQGNGESGVYSVTYAAASSGQTLTVRWTLEQAGGPNANTANVTLQAAALSAPGANNPPVVALTSPADNAAFSAGANIAISANAFDPDTTGAIAKVEFFQNGTKLGESTNKPYSLTWTNVSAGNYFLTARAWDDRGATGLSAPAEIFVNGTGGALSGRAGLPTNSLNGSYRIDLTAEGSGDWAHWGLSTPASFDHKAVPQQLGNFTAIGPGTIQRLTNYVTQFSWSDGTPTAATNSTTSGIFIYGLANGFKITAPADTSSRSLKVYLGLYGTQGRFEAYLSDFSAPAYSDTTLKGATVYDDAYASYTLDYRAASSGQMLVVEFTAGALFDADYGNVAIESATLTNATLPTNAPPTITITSPTNNATFTSPADITIVAEPFDSDGSISLVEFFQNSSKLGETTGKPYSFSWTNVSAGSYILTARATDNLGTATVSSPIAVVVSPSAPAPVVIVSPSISAGALFFSFATQAGRNYSVQFTDSLAPVNWQEATNITGTGAAASVTNTIASTDRFYRVETQ
jgi:hypothetical protein